MIARDDAIEVQTAPDKDQSFLDHDFNRSNYTVIGNYKEFGPPLYTDHSVPSVEDVPG